MQIDFNDPEFASVGWDSWILGGQRHQQSVKDGRADRHGARFMSNSDRLTVHRQGSFAEGAASLVCLKPWPMSINSFSKKKPDIGTRGQVRCRPQAALNKGQQDLLIRPDDDESQIFILVYELQKFRIYDVLGGIECRDAKSTKWEHRDRAGNYGLTYFIPPAALIPIEELRKMDW